MLVKNEIDGHSGAALVELEDVGKGLSLLKRNEGKHCISGKGQIECCSWSSMSVRILLPSRSVALVVAAVFNAPVVAGCRGGTRFFLGRQAGAEEAGVALLDVGLFFLSLHSRRTVAAERAPGRWALTGEMAVRHPDGARCVRGRLPDSLKKGGVLQSVVGSLESPGDVFLGANEVVAAFLQDDLNGVVFVVQRVGVDQGVGQLHPVIG